MSKTSANRFILDDTVREYSPLQAIKRLFDYIRPYKTIAVAALVLSLLSSALLILRPYLMKEVIDNYIENGDVSGLDRFMLLFLCVYLLRFFVDRFMQMLTGYLGQYIMHDLRMDIFSHILSMEMHFFDRNKVGRLMTRTTDDVNALNELYTSGAIRILHNSSIIVGIVIMMFIIDFKLALITLSITPFMYVIARVFANRIRVVYRNIRKGTARLNAFLQESIQGIRIIQTMRRTSWSFDKFSRYSDNLKTEKIKNVFYYGWFFPLMELIGTIGVVLIISASGYRIGNGTLEIGVMVAFIRLVDMFFWPVRELAENFNVMLSALAASERIFTLLDTEPSIKNPHTAVEIDRETEIRFENVWFAYEGEDWILKDVSFTVAPGEKVAFVGPSGAGKTSIMSLLLRYYDIQKGRILINGVDILDLSIEDHRRHFSYVGQEAFLFNRSVRDNISLGDEMVDASRIEDVLARFCADSCFSELEDGLETNVRERGSRLSQGQRQLVSFARALAADRDVLVLDEATSSVDTFTESLIQNAVPVLMEGRTSIVIAHRLSTVRTVDKIHVIAGGRIVESGNHSELMSENGLYARLSRMHMG